MYFNLLSYTKTNKIHIKAFNTLVSMSPSYLRSAPYTTVILFLFINMNVSRDAIGKHLSLIGQATFQYQVFSCLCLRR